MAFQILPARRTGGQEFSEAFSPYLAQAFQMIMQKKIQDEQFKKNIELAKQMGLMTETQPGLQDYQQQIQGQGGALNVDPNLPSSEQFAVAQKLFRGAGVKPPQPQYALQSRPGMKTSMKFEGGVPSFGVETMEQKEEKYPLEFKTDLSKAIQLLPTLEESKKVSLYQDLAAKYPGKTSELKRIFFPLNTDNSMIENLIASLRGEI